MKTVKKKIAGYVVINKYGPVGYCKEEEGRDKAGAGVLWADGSTWMATLFTSEKEAQKAVALTEAYASRMGYDRVNYPIWYDHTIFPVRKA